MQHRGVIIAIAIIGGIVSTGTRVTIVCNGGRIRDLVETQNFASLLAYHLYLRIILTNTKHRLPCATAKARGGTRSDDVPLAHMQLHLPSGEAGWGYFPIFTLWKTASISEYMASA